MKESIITLETELKDPKEESKRLSNNNKQSCQVNNRLQAKLDQAKSKIKNMAQLNHALTTTIQEIQVQ